MNTKLSKIKKCKGCGLPLSTNKKDLAYTPNTKLDYCQRCFRLKHYGINSKDEIALLKTSEILDQLAIKERDWIFLINDIINIDFTVINKFKNHQKIIFIFNKADLIVNAFNYTDIQKRVIALLNSCGINKPKVVLTSTTNNVGIRKLFESLKEIDWNEKIYFIGKSNSGKSSVINALIRYSGSVIKPLTVSGYLNTTIDVKQIKLQKHNVIDTPGFNSQSSVLANLTKLEDVGSIRNKQKIKPATFQIHEDQGFIVDNFCFLQCECKNKGSITFYIPNKVHVHRTKISNLYRNLKNNINQAYDVNDAKRVDHEHILDTKVKYNILVEGLGLFSIKGISKILINTFVNVSVVLLDTPII